MTHCPGDELAEGGQDGRCNLQKQEMQFLNLRHCIPGTDACCSCSLADLQMLGNTETQDESMGSLG